MSILEQLAAIGMFALFALVILGIVALAKIIRRIK